MISCVCPVTLPLHFPKSRPHLPQRGSSRSTPTNHPLNEHPGEFRLPPIECCVFVNTRHIPPICQSVVCTIHGWVENFLLVDVVDHPLRMWCRWHDSNNFSNSMADHYYYCCCYCCCCCYGCQYRMIFDPP